MTSAELYRLIELPEEMKELFTRWDGELTPQADEELTERLLDRTRWDGAVQELYERVGEDPDHLKVLWEELRIGAAQWPKWQAKGIPEDIYRDTMAFGTRYLYDGKKAYGTAAGALPPDGGSSGIWPWSCSGWDRWNMS